MCKTQIVHRHCHPVYQSIVRMLIIQCSRPTICFVWLTTGTLISSGVGVRLKVGDKYWEDWRGRVWGGVLPSPVGGLGACPQKKICAKNYAILSKFWYFFPILQQKVGDYPPVLKVGDLSPCPPAPMPMLISISDCWRASNVHRTAASCDWRWLQSVTVMPADSSS